MTTSERFVRFYRPEWDDEDTYVACDGDPGEDAPFDDTPCDNVTDAVAAIVGEGLSFAATGGDWAGWLDVTSTNYRTGAVTCVTAHLYGFEPWQERAIMRLVDSGRF